MKQRLLILGFLITAMGLVVLGCSNSAVGLAAGPMAPATYSVTYYTNSPTTGSAPGMQTKIQGTALTLAANSGTMVRTGCTFSGWNTTADGSGTCFAAGATYSADAALALFAKWSLSDLASSNIGNLKLVPAGTFQRDATATNTSYVSAFRMSATEITRAQFVAMLGTDPSLTEYSTGTSDPVQIVNWYHAIAFCNKLSLAEGRTPVYCVSGVDFAALTFSGIPTTRDTAWEATTATWANNGYRLPTEMEWEWAAMGAIAGTSGYLKAFAGSTGRNAVGDYAWYSGNGFSVTRAAGTKLPNELGLYDMSGNVWEWNWDLYADDYPTGAISDYRGPSSNQYRVIHGGSSWNSAYDLTTAYRYGSNPLTQSVGIGFRVVAP